MIFNQITDFFHLYTSYWYSPLTHAIFPVQLPTAATEHRTAAVNRCRLRCSLLTEFKQTGRFFFFFFLWGIEWHMSQCDVTDGLFTRKADPTTPLAAACLCACLHFCKCWPRSPLWSESKAVKKHRTCVRLSALLVKCVIRADHIPYVSKQQSCKLNAVLAVRNVLLSCENLFEILSPEWANTVSEGGIIPWAC